MVDTVDSKSAASTGVRVRVPSLLPTSPEPGHLRVVSSVGRAPDF